MRRKMKMKSGLSDRIYNICVMIIALSALLLVLYPMYFIVIASFSSSTLVNQGQVILLPKGINFYGYQKILERFEIWRGYRKIGRAHV